MSITKAADMERVSLAARILKVDGILLLVVGAVHLSATPLALDFISSQSTKDAYAQIKPPFLLSFLVVGILLVPVGYSTLFCANSLREGEHRARTLCFVNAVSVMMLPLALLLAMSTKYFRAIPFLVAASLVWIVAISMWVAVALVRSKSPS